MLTSLEQLKEVDLLQFVTYDMTEALTISYRR